MKKIIVIGILIGLTFSQPVQAATSPLDNYLNQILEIFLNLVKDLPESMKTIFEEQVLPIWKEMYEWFKKNIWEEIRPRTEEEIERRKKIVQQELERKKEELIKELEELLIFNRIKDFLIKIWK